MDKKIAIIISPNWRNYASKYLEACLASLKDQIKANIKVFLIDNESSAETEQYIQAVAEKNLPTGSWELITSSTNDGFARGNNLALKRAIAENFDYCILFNMDGRIGEGCIEKLVEQAESDAKIGAVQARMMLWPDTNLVNSLGNITHFLGYGYCLGYKQIWAEIKQIKKEIAYPSGAAVLFSVPVLKKVGIFDEEFWMYNEDQDLGWRLWLAGFRVELCASAVFYHEYEFSRSTSKFYWMDRNRLIAIFKNYSCKSLLLIAPALIALEVVSPILAWRGGWLKEKIKVWQYFLRPKTWKYLKQARRESQVLRQGADKSILKMFSGRIEYQEVNSPLVNLGNIFLNAYFWFVRKII